MQHNDSRTRYAGLSSQPSLSAVIGIGDAEGAAVRTGEPTGDWRKRALDIALAATALVALLPLILLVMLAIRLSSPGPVVYGHERIGRGGRRFRCLKFRTMVTDGDRVLKTHLASCEASRKEWEESRKLRKDPRVTGIGAVLRSTSVDELPQLINILRGDMSLVGPRPVVQDEMRFYGPLASLYYSARPGLTGLWQVSGRSDVSYDARVAFDRLYVESWSLRGDIMLILRTVPAVLLRRGTY